MITNDAKCACKIKSTITMAKAAINKKKTFLTKKLDLNLWTKLVKWCNWSMALYNAETWTLQKVDQKYLSSSETLCWRRVDTS
jgi:hypothetical protein